MAERERRFGGNMERANTGIPYPTGGRDVRFEGSLPLQYQYRDKGRTVVSDTEPAWTDMGRNRNVPFPQSTGTPNFRPPYGAPGQPSYGEWMQQIDPYPGKEGIEQIPSGNFLRRLFGDLRNQAFGPQGPLTANYTQTWKKIRDKVSEEAADKWLEAQQADASDWIDYIPGNPFSKNKVGQLPIDLDPFQGTVGFDKQFDLPFGGTGNIEADYDLNDQRFKTGIMGNWKWG